MNIITYIEQIRASQEVPIHLSHSARGRIDAAKSKKPSLLQSNGSTNEHDLQSQTLRMQGNCVEW